MQDDLIHKLKSKKVIEYKSKEVIPKSESPIEIMRQEGAIIDESVMVQVKQMGEHIELKYMRTIPTEMPILKIDENTYLVKKTGEIKNFKQSKTRDEQQKSLKRTFKRLRELINTNFRGSPNEKFITLTYRKKQRDHEQVYSDFKIWIKKVRKKYGACDYINVVEPQASGSWHCHVLIKFYELPQNHLDYNEFRKLWVHGSYVNVQNLDNCTNIGAYLSAYLSDVELTDQTLNKACEEMGEIEIKKVVIDGKEKAFIKGGRLHYYPSKMNLYRRSKGIVEPVKYFSGKSDIDLSDYELTYSNKIDLTQDEKVVNTIHYENYSKKRHKKSLTESANLLSEK